MVLGGVTALLVFATIWDLVRKDERAPGSRRLVAQCERVTRVTWERPGNVTVSIEGDGHAYEVRVGEARWPADGRVVEDVLGTLELLAPYRALAAARAERGLDRPRLRVHVTCEDGRATTLALGDRIAAMDRVWLARLDELDKDYLIEGHAARALERNADDLRQRRVFASIAASLVADGLAGDARIELRAGGRTVALSGRPASVALEVAGADVRARAELDHVSALVRGLRDVTLVRFVDDPGGGAGRYGAGRESLRIEVHDRDGATAVLEEIGPCPEAAPAGPGEVAGGTATKEARALRLVRTRLGAGCVAADALARVAALVAEPSRMIARTLVAPGWQRIRVIGEDGAELTFTPRGGDVSMTVDHGSHGSETLAAERAAVDEWLDALAGAASGAIVPLAGLGGLPAPALSLIVQQSGIEDAIEVYRDPRPGAGPRWLARRNGEPLYLVLDVAPHAAAIAPVAPLRFLPRTLLVREPFALREVIARDQGRASEHLRRGELLDDWEARAPARARVRPGIVDSLRQTLARLRALRFVAETPASAHRLTPPRRRVEAAFDPGPFDHDLPIRDRIDIGADTPRGCLARLDTGRPGPVFELDRRACDALLGPWTAP